MKVDVDKQDKMADSTEATGDQPGTYSHSCCLSITNVPNAVFEDENVKNEFEQLFVALDEGAVLSYLKSFRRVRVTYNTSQQAGDAKLVLHGAKYRGSELGVYFVQGQPSTSGVDSCQLQLPPLTKQFLISPPTSPPVGWEQSHESSPVINYDLLSAVASLSKSEPYELHPPDSNAPSIVVHFCGNDDDDDDDEKVVSQEDKAFHPLRCLPRETVQTRRPEDGR